MKNLKILITYFLLEPLGCALVDPNVAGTGGPGCVTLRPLGWRRVVECIGCSGVDEKLGTWEEVRNSEFQYSAVFTGAINTGGEGRGRPLSTHFGRLRIPVKPATHST